MGFLILGILFYMTSLYSLWIMSRVNLFVMFYFSFIVWACFMAADLVLGIEKSDLSLLNSILYLLTSCVLGQMVWICVDFIWEWILKYMHITTEASWIMYIFFSVRSQIMVLLGNFLIYFACFMMSVRRFTMAGKLGTNKGSFGMIKIDAEWMGSC